MAVVVRWSSSPLHAGWRYQNGREEVHWSSVEETFSFSNLSFRNGLSHLAVRVDRLIPGGRPRNSQKDRARETEALDLENSWLAQANWTQSRLRILEDDITVKIRDWLNVRQMEGGRKEINVWCWWWGRAVCFRFYVLDDFCLIVAYLLNLFTSGKIFRFV